MTAYIGIDPGMTGGLALITGDTAEAWRYPGDVQTAAKLLLEVSERCDGITLACIEKVGAMPKQGVSSTFKFGMNYGAWQGALAALHIPYITVTPQKWQRTLLDAGTGETKARSLNMARRLFPCVDLRFKADDGKADALHLARWARLEHGGDTSGN